MEESLGICPAQSLNDKCTSCCSESDDKCTPGCVPPSSWCRLHRTGSCSLCLVLGRVGLHHALAPPCEIFPLFLYSSCSFDLSFGSVGLHHAVAPPAAILASLSIEEKNKTYNYSMMQQGLETSQEHW